MQAALHVRAPEGILSAVLTTLPACSSQPSRGAEQHSITAATKPPSCSAHCSAAGDGGGVDRLGASLQPSLAPSGSLPAPHRLTLAVLLRTGWLVLLDLSAFFPAANVTSLPPSDGGGGGELTPVTSITLLSPSSSGGNGGGIGAPTDGAESASDDRGDDGSGGGGGGIGVQRQPLAGVEWCAGEAARAVGKENAVQHGGLGPGGGPARQLPAKRAGEAVLREPQHLQHPPQHPLLQHLKHHSQQQQHKRVRTEPVAPSGSTPAQEGFGGVEWVKLPFSFLWAHQDLQITCTLALHPSTSSCCPPVHLPQPSGRSAAPPGQAAANVAGLGCVESVGDRHQTASPAWERIPKVDLYRLLYGCRAQEPAQASSCLLHALLDSTAATSTAAATPPAAAEVPLAAAATSTAAAGPAGGGVGCQPSSCSAAPQLSSVMISRGCVLVGTASGQVWAAPLDPVASSVAPAAGYGAAGEASAAVHGVRGRWVGKPCPPCSRELKCSP